MYCGCTLHALPFPDSFINNNPAYRIPERNGSRMIKVYRKLCRLPIPTLKFNLTLSSHFKLHEPVSLGTRPTLHKSGNQLYRFTRRNVKIRAMKNVIQFIQQECFSKVFQLSAMLGQRRQRLMAWPVLQAFYDSLKACTTKLSQRQGITYSKGCSIGYRCPT